MALPPLTPSERQKVTDLPTAREKVAALAEYALARLGSHGEDSPKYSNEIVAAIKELHPAIASDIADSTLKVYLNTAPASNPRVISLGTARGYYYDGTGAASILEEQSFQPEPEPGERRNKEAKLYEHIKNWLIANGYRAKIVAQGKSLGPWGNPDVVGIQTIDILGNWQAQTVSVEVKLSNLNWQRDIFEAISHRRYFDRSYFCYPVLANNRQIAEELKDYAELYSVGILLVELAPSELEKLNRGDNLDADNLSITEACPAPYAMVMPKYRKLAFTAIGISDLGGLFAWGTPPAEA